MATLKKWRGDAARNDGIGVPKKLSCSEILEGRSSRRISRIFVRHTFRNYFICYQKWGRDCLRPHDTESNSVLGPLLHLRIKLRPVLKGDDACAWRFGLAEDKHGGFVAVPETVKRELQSKIMADNHSKHLASASEPLSGTKERL